MANGDDKGRLGQCLRSIRKGRGLTLEEVARQTGIARSTLSKVENGQMSLTYDKLLQISEGLRVDIAELFGASQQGGPGSGMGRRSMFWRGEGANVETKNYDHVYMFTDLAKKRMQPIMCRMHARTMEEFGDLVTHSGEEFIVVLEGAIEVVTEFYSPVRLEAGDGIYIDSGMKHAYLSVGDGDARAIAVCSSSSEDILEALPPAPRLRAATEPA
ncbi:XRE family transcriptional regulator [Phenylobacterium sp. LH3H17]|uniref:helix-turn-helix domain-containing protein n=1 Tax=Phenylobacterium sp. LH3H17 TaxID=2903901 RepID=UPI0020C9C929|nr:XRE family transcriptional regulator [Phenylobacterium sp. LH3H17]UTP38299.1 XRE family transcriptional regulator [Phenylobacterium sp. LH3H17]